MLYTLYIIILAHYSSIKLEDKKKSLCKIKQKTESIALHLDRHMCKYVNAWKGQKGPSKLILRVTSGKLTGLGFGVIQELSFICIFCLSVKYSHIITHLSFVELKFSIKTLLEV